jgi:hypothetical protein
MVRWPASGALVLVAGGRISGDGTAQQRHEAGGMGTLWRHELTKGGPRIPRGFSQSKPSAWVYSRVSGVPRSTARSGAAT